MNPLHLAFHSQFFACVFWCSQQANLPRSCPTCFRGSSLGCSLSFRGINKRRLVPVQRLTSPCSYGSALATRLAPFHGDCVPFCCFFKLPAAQPMKPPQLLSAIFLHVNEEGERSGEMSPPAGRRRYCALTQLLSV